MEPTRKKEHHPVYLDLPLELWHLVYQNLPWPDVLTGALVSSSTAASISSVMDSHDDENHSSKNNKITDSSSHRILTLSMYCQSQIWSKIEADDWVYEGLVQGLVRNSSFLRRLSCSPKSRLEQLSYQQDCRSLTHLDIEQTRFLNTGILDRLLANNRDSLQSLRIKLDRSFHFQTLVGKHLSSMKELRELSLQFWEGVTQEGIAMVLETCPWIETFSLGHNSLYPFTLDNLVSDSSRASVMVTTTADEKPLNDDEAKISAAEDAITDFNSRVSNTRNNPRSFQIRNLILDEAIIFHEELILNLCARCPDLESLSMQGCFGIRLSSDFITQLSNLCPKLQRVNFKNLSTAEDFYSQLFRVVPRLLHVTMTGSNLTHWDVEIMIDHSGMTIQSVDVGYCTSLESKSILKILMGCPNLVTFDARGVDFNPRDMMEPADEWICHGSLQSLSLEVLLPKRSHYASGEIHAVRTKFYQQLSRCTKLINLQLGAGARDRGINILELSLLTGLEQLATLSQMERLDIKRLNHAVRAPEVSWMLANWPRLKAIGALQDISVDSELLHAVQKSRSIFVW
ncbi:hypothetical protein BG004_002183 [Podila humilis]|nr:hypothetical protein BG004_002183 [Podila humilis]